MQQKFSKSWCKDKNCCPRLGSNSQPLQFQCCGFDPHLGQQFLSLDRRLWKLFRHISINYFSLSYFQYILLPLIQNDCRTCFGPQKGVNVTPLLIKNGYTDLYQISRQLNIGKYKLLLCSFVPALPHFLFSVSTPLHYFILFLELHISES